MYLNTLLLQQILNFGIILVECFSKLHASCYLFVNLDRLHEENLSFQ